MHMVAHGSRDADAAGRTFRLKSRRHIDCIAMQVSPIGNRVANVNSDAKSDCSIWLLISVNDRNLLLHPQGAAYRTVDAVEHDEQEIAADEADNAVMLFYLWVYQVAAQSPQPLQSSCVIQANQTAVANHIRVDHGD